MRLNIFLIAQKNQKNEVFCRKLEIIANINI